MTSSATLRVLLNGALKTGTPRCFARREIDLVGADAEAADREQTLARVERLRGDARLAADAEHVDAAGEALGELVLLQRLPDRFDLEAFGREDLVRGGVDVLEQEDLDLVLGCKRGRDGVLEP